MFLKGLVHGFDKKFEILSSLYLWGKRPGIYAFHDILERKKTFWDYKNKKLKKPEKLGFFRRG